jgi:hypothetical protein
MYQRSINTTTVEIHGLKLKAIPTVNDNTIPKEHTIIVIIRLVKGNEGIYKIT